MGEILGRASTQYSELVGTAAFDRADHIDATGLDELLALIDPGLAKSYHVVGFDLHSEKDLVSRHGEPEHHPAWGTLYLCDISQLQEGGLDEARDADGALPVIALDIPDSRQVDIGEFLTRAFKRVDIRAALRRDAGPMPLRPVEAIELPEEE